MRILLLIYLIGCTICLNAQPGSIGETYLCLEDTSRNNRQIPVQVYYSSDSSGMNVPFIDTAKKRYPWIIFTHGYLLKPEGYQNIYNTLVPHGYIVVMPSTGTQLFPSHSELAKDIIYLAKNLKDFTGLNQGILKNRLDTLFCIMGHSMGGGCSCLAAAEVPDADALVTLAAFDTNPSAISAATEIRIPSLVFSGSRDRITRPRKNQVPIYENIATEKKTWINILGGSHCQMMSKNGLCRTGELMLLNSPSVSRDKQLEILNRYLVSWLAYYLKGDEEAGHIFFNDLINDPEIEFKSEEQEVGN